jgi:hypothetical protein
MAFIIRLYHDAQSSECQIHKDFCHCHQYSMEKDLTNVDDITHVKSLSKIYMLHLSYWIVAFTRPIKYKKNTVKHNSVDGFIKVYSYIVSLNLKMAHN